MRPIRLGQFFPQTLGNGFFFRVFRVFRGFTRTLNQTQSNLIKAKKTFPSTAGKGRDKGRDKGFHLPGVWGRLCL